MTPQESTQSMLDNTRKLATHAMERAEGAVKDWRDTVQGATSRSVHTLSDTAAAAQRQLGHYAQNSTRYVAEHPMKSALIAAAIGAAVAGLVLALRHRRDNDNTF
jgi:ElaB/YqjD/DUF883 family membrane-anchored ribosome-binding protein